MRLAANSIVLFWSLLALPSGAAGCNGSFSFDSVSGRDGAVGDATSDSGATDASLSDGSLTDSAREDAEGNSATTDAAGDAPDLGEDEGGPLFDPGTNCADAGACEPSSELCCTSTSGYACLESGQDVCNGTRIFCDDSVGCPANAPFCCADEDYGQVQQVSCEKSCADKIICDPYNTQCPTGLTCLPYNARGLPPGYLACQ